MSKDRANFHVACYMIIEENNKILLQKRCGSGYFDGYYSVPAGHLEENEKCIDCIIREFKEETNLYVNKEDVGLLFTLGASEKCNYICLFFGAKKYSGEIKVMEPHKCSELAFFDLNDLPENIVPELRTFLEGRKTGVIYGDERD